MTTPAIASKFHILYEGEGLKGGQIDARALADSLTALADTLEKGNRIINGRNAQIAVRVDANILTGSFKITIMTAIQSLAEFGATPTFEGLKNVAELIGLAIGGAGITAAATYKIGKTLFRFIKEAKNKKIKAIKSTDENNLSTVILEDDTEIDELSAQVIDMFNDPSIRLSIENMTQILNVDGIASMSFWDDLTPEKEREAITKDEAPFFKAPKSSIMLERKDERILMISQASLIGEKSGWRFKYDSDDPNDFQADIVDPSFLDKIKNREIVLKNGDMIRALLQTQQSRPRRNLKTEYTVLRVLEFLPFDDNET